MQILQTKEKQSRGSWRSFFHICSTANRTGQIRFPVFGELFIFRFFLTIVSISSSVMGCFGLKCFRKWCDLLFSPPFLHFQIFQRLAWGGATIVALIVITSSSLSETSEPLQPRSHFLLAFLKLLRLARGGRCICLLITDWPKGVPASLAGDEMFILMRTQTGVATTKHTHTLPLTHTGTLSFFFSLDFYPSLCRSNTRLKITLFLALTLGHAHTQTDTHSSVEWLCGTAAWG